ncbi:golgin subfamily A member 6-like protein 10 isoform X2 [Littorina saxatilis]|uniref:golgin subfamily A member 6-like protein 10 isoform X2 n=1 Tax=Littorina saxatilis TaxID=31220 RepID=UPI0038B63473
MALFNSFILAVVLCSAHAEYDKNGEFPETGQDVMHNVLRDMKSRLNRMEETIRQQDQKIQTLSTRLLHQEEVITTQSQQLKHQQEDFEKRLRQQKALFRKELISQRKYFQKQNGRLLKDLGLSLKRDRETEVDKQLFHVHEQIAAQTDKKMAENGTPPRPEEDYHHGDVSSSSSFAQLKRSDDNALETAVAHVAQQMAEITSEIQALKNVNKQQDDVIADRGTSYIRWGHTGCPASADLVYTGIIGGSHQWSTGGAGNHLCLTSHPAFDGHRQPTGNGNAEIYGSEYEICPEPECQLTPACAACRVPRTTSLMIPGTNVCSSGWTKEYSGYIMAGYHGYPGSSEFICVDSSHGYINTSQNDDNQNLIYYTHAKCGALPCPPYVDEKLVTCVVCSK